MEYCVYYDKNSMKIIDFLPKDLNEDLKAKIQKHWSHEIKRNILLFISENGEQIAPRIKDAVGHSMSTLHDNVLDLEKDGLIATEMVYSIKRQRVIKPKIFFITKNPKHMAKLKEFFNRGIWVDSEKTKSILDFLQENPSKYFSSEEISIKTKIPVDEVNVLLSNWDSQVTRAFSDMFKEKPFETKVLYKAK